MRKNVNTYEARAEKCEIKLGTKLHKTRVHVEHKRAREEMIKRGHEWCHIMHIKVHEVHKTLVHVRLSTLWSDTFYDKDLFVSDFILIGL